MGLGDLAAKIFDAHRHRVYAIIQFADGNPKGDGKLLDALEVVEDRQHMLAQLDAALVRQRPIVQCNANRSQADGIARQALDIDVAGARMKLVRKRLAE